MAFQVERLHLSVCGKFQKVSDLQRLAEAAGGGILHERPVVKERKVKALREVTQNLVYSQKRNLDKGFVRRKKKIIQRREKGKEKKRELNPITSSYFKQFKVVFISLMTFKNILNCLLTLDIT